MTSPALLSRDLSRLILDARGHRVILDVNLAKIYGVTTKALNQAVKRNQDRFPGAFLFQLTQDELPILRSQIVTSSSHGGRRYLPYVFTEHGALMAANVLNSPTAVKMSIALVQAFIQLREVLSTHQVHAKRLAEIERTILAHDAALQDLYRKIRPLLLPPPDPPKRKIGFHSHDD
jgi:hypothetical protein